MEETLRVDYMKLYLKFEDSRYKHVGDIIWIWFSTSMQIHLHRYKHTYIGYVGNCRQQPSPNGVLINSNLNIAAPTTSGVICRAAETASRSVAELKVTAFPNTLHFFFEVICKYEKCFVKFSY